MFLYKWIPKILEISMQGIFSLCISIFHTSAIFSWLTLWGWYLVNHNTTTPQHARGRGGLVIAHGSLPQQLLNTYRGPGQQPTHTTQNVHLVQQAEKLLSTNTRAPWCPPWTACSLRNLCGHPWVTLCNTQCWQVWAHRLNCRYEK